MSSVARIIGILLALLLIVSAIPTASAAASNCRFVFGFKALHDAIPDIVGDCVVNEHFQVNTGNSLQETTGTRTDGGVGGLLVWRKSDNFTAYTDGYRTWVAGPNGIEQRYNWERFPWENDPPDPLALVPQGSAPDAAPNPALAQIEARCPSFVSRATSWRYERARLNQDPNDWGALRLHIAQAFGCDPGVIAPPEWPNDPRFNQFGPLPPPEPAAVCVTPDDPTRSYALNLPYGWGQTMYAAKRLAWAQWMTLTWDAWPGERLHLETFANNYEPGSTESLYLELSKDGVLLAKQVLNGARGTWDLTAPGAGPYRVGVVNNISRDQLVELRGFTCR